ncbi:MAG: hypothetical protein MUF72_06080 [Elainella sp. Prado103]|jgi:hypothetical protein|nr:hypothetical protein [Elainella sp. Prado103]
MATASRNRPKTVSVSKTALDHVGSLLQDLSAKPKEEMSLREAIDELREPIQGALAKGYSYEDIVEILGDRGIKTTAATVKRYISLGNPRKRKPRATAGKSGRRTRSVSAAVVEPSVQEPVSAASSRSTASRTSPSTPTRGRSKSVAASVDAAPQTKVQTAKPNGKTKAQSSAVAQQTTPSKRGRKKSG